MRFLLALLALLACGFSAPRSVCAQQPDLPIAPSASASLTGTVTDPDGDLINGAHLALTLPGRPAQSVTTSTDGSFRFASAAGATTLLVTAPGYTPRTIPIALAPGAALVLPPIALRPASAAAIQVTVSRYDLAETELHTEETQRVLGILPNFFVSYDWHAVPLTTGQKFHLSLRTIVDPVTLLANGAFAGIEQATDTFPGYGQGATGYFKRFGAANADTVVGTLLGGAVFPALFHQDPRYFYKGTGTRRQRALYALSTAVISRGDNGRWQPAYASILGDFSAGAVSNLYYPASDRHGAQLTLANGAIAVAFDGIQNLIQEFVLPSLTPHLPHH